MTRTNPTARRLWLALVPLALLSSPALGQGVNEANERAMKAAAARAAPSIVKIETFGGTETIGAPMPKGPPGMPPPKAVRRGSGATTGVIVAPDGYVISSAFNFANKPGDIVVSIPGRPGKFVAEIVATDQTRMLTLLRVRAAPGTTFTDLPVPAAYPKKDVLVGQWGLALGRTLDPDVEHPPSISAGIVSATNRIWGKAIQTDAKLSPVNYGGPLVAIDGRVLGIIVPASPRAEGETAGFDWYDSGIGFAIPFEDVLAALPRLRAGKDLRRGLLGINPQGTDVYNSPPVIGAIQPDSAAARAGLKVGDRILAIDDRPVPNYSTLQHILGPKYDGDVVKIKVSRDGKEQEFANIMLSGTSTAQVVAFLGILPLRDDPTPGVPVRYVYPDSPAATAGLKPGDRILKLGPASAMMLPPIRNRAALAAVLAGLTPGTEIKIEVKRKDGDKTETLTTKLVAAPDVIPEDLPLPSSAGKALEGAPKTPKKSEPMPGKCGEELDEQEVSAQDPKEEKPKTGYQELTNAALARDYWVYVPDGYDPNVSHGLIVWLHPAGQGGKDGKPMAATFRKFCEAHNFIIMGSISSNAEGWVASETEGVLSDVKAVMSLYTIDKTRVIAHGMGNGGEMAFYLGFNARDVFRGVAAVGAGLASAPKENVANQPLAFFIVGGDKDPAYKDIVIAKDLLLEKRFPVVFRKMDEAGKEYLDAKTFGEMLRWMDALDRL